MTFMLQLSPPQGTLRAQAADTHFCIAAPQNIAPLRAVGGANELPAWRSFCDRHPIECRVDQREAESHSVDTGDLGSPDVSQIGRSMRASSP